MSSKLVNPTPRMFYNRLYLPEDPALRPDALTLRVCDVSVVLSVSTSIITLRRANLSSKSSQQKLTRHFTEPGRGYLQFYTFRFTP